MRPVIPEPAQGRRGFRRTATAAGIPAASSMVGEKLAQAAMDGALPIPEGNPALRELLPRLRERYGQARLLQQLDSLRRHGDTVDDPQLWLQTALEHGFKFMPIECIQECPCGSRETVLLYHYVFWNLLALRECRHCGLLFVSPRLTRQAMYEVFNKWYFDHSNQEFWGARRLPVFRDILRILRRYDCHYIFDVGAAYGHFLAWARKQGIDGAGCDISEAPVQWGRSHLQVTLYNGGLLDLDLPPSSVDCVVSLDTFYYVSDPLAELRAIRRLVKIGGYVVLRLRNGLRILARARRKAKKPLGTPVLPSQHLWAYAPNTAAHLLTQNGFEVVLYEPAAYSRTLLLPLHSLLVPLMRAACAPPLGAPILTHSFNIVGRRLS